MRQSNAGTYNLISFIFLAMSLLICFATVGIVSESFEVPAALRPDTPIPQPSLIARQLPTVTNTPIPTDTPRATPTRTPSATPTVTATQTATVTETDVPTLTATFTQTATPSSTFTLTFTPSPSPTITLTPTATGFTSTPTRTPAAFPFRVDDVDVRPDLDEACNFQGFAGYVYDIIGEPETGLLVVVTGVGLPSGGLSAVSGQNTNYGPSGWEVRTSAAPVRGTYSVQLARSDGTPLSQAVEVSFPGNCDSNLVLLSFRRERPD
jgi:hypothetical protein